MSDIVPPAPRAPLPPAAELPPRLIENARLLPRRESVLPLIPAGGRFVEVGVAMGDFSNVVLRGCAPAEFVAIDTFTLHRIPMLWGVPAAERFGEATHRALYESRFAGEIAAGRVRLIEADSAVAIASLEDASVDLLYLDADHRAEAVAADLAAGLPKMREGGWIMLNDYIMADVVGGCEPYGVVQATHDFMLRENWEMIYFALHPLMYCDVVLRRAR